MMLSLIASALVAPTQLAPHKSLGRIKAGDLQKLVRFLASDELAGRGTPSAGLDRSADFLADAFKKVGVAASGENGSYFQVAPWTPLRSAGASAGAQAGPATAKNVIAKVAGSDDELSKEAILVSAHYDHLGEGGQEEDKIF